MELTTMISMTKEELGDYQTPTDFCDVVCQLLKNKYKLQPSHIVEPTMGLGNFLVSASKCFDSLLFGIEMNAEYVEKARISLPNATLFESNIFTFDFQSLKDCFNEGQNTNILFLGNPPWVTNSTLSSIGSYNLPYKDNFKKERGFDAVTGKGNFDICEYILLQLMSEFSNYKNAYFAFLCKEIVAKNIVRDLDKYNFSLDFVDLYSFDASKVFGVNCDAVLFVTRIGERSSSIEANVFSIDEPDRVINRFGWVNNTFVSDIDSYHSDYDGVCQMVWRQGIKHDCSKVMEFKKDSSGRWFNKYGEEISFFDSEFIYPLVKSSDFKKKIIESYNRRVIVTQNYVREDTSKLKKDEELFSYLMSHSKDFEKRKSIIYKNTPQFSIFGIGDYSFSKYKIGLSGFYKEPNFSFLSSDKPVMVDDTCYFIGTNNKHFSMILFVLLDSDCVYSFLKTISFKNSKRPFTKDVLQRIDLLKILESVSMSYIKQKVFNVFNERIDDKDINELRISLESKSIE